MKQFSIAIHSFADIQEFVSLSSRQPFAVTVGDTQQDISGKSLMAMLGLNFRRPLMVSVDCDDAQFAQLQLEAAKFLT